MSNRCHILTKMDYSYHLMDYHYHQMEYSYHLMDYRSLVLPLIAPEETNCQGTSVKTHRHLSLNHTQGIQRYYKLYQCLLADSVRYSIYFTPSIVVVFHISGGYDWSETLQNESWGTKANFCQICQNIFCKI